MPVIKKNKLVRDLVVPNWTDKEIHLWVRQGTSDEETLDEVIHRRAYRKPSAGVDVCEGECWLDLGANIGAFAAYCFLKGAIAKCYEPTTHCFKILEKNLKQMGKGFAAHQLAITVHDDEYLEAWESKKDDNYWRTTIIPVESYQSAGKIPNLHVSNLGDLVWDGVKMDIEGSEHDIIDQGLLPKCNKLAMEYHINRDNKNMKNFHGRMKLLRKIFETVSYAPSLDKQRETYEGRFDFLVHCSGRK